jgi:hypothetical protein
LAEFCAGIFAPPTFAPLNFAPPTFAPIFVMQFFLPKYSNIYFIVKIDIFHAR